MKIFSVIVGIILCVVLIPIAVMNVTITVKTYLYPDKTADFFGYKPFVVVTESMAGTIDGGDIAVVRAVDPSVLKIGDIIAFRDGKSVVTHSQIEGVYLFRIPKVGHLSLFLQSPRGLLTVIGVLVTGALFKILPLKIKTTREK